jgi:hypothetical protein
MTPKLESIPMIAPSSMAMTRNSWFAVATPAACAAVSFVRGWI